MSNRSYLTRSCDSGQDEIALETSASPAPPPRSLPHKTRTQLHLDVAAGGPPGTHPHKQETLALPAPLLRMAHRSAQTKPVGHSGARVTDTVKLFGEKSCGLAICLINVGAVGRWKEGQRRNPRELLRGAVGSHHCPLPSSRGLGQPTYLPDEPHSHPVTLPPTK